MVLAHTFFKPYISKICNGFSLYNNNNNNNNNNN